MLSFRQTPEVRMSDGWTFTSSCCLDQPYESVYKHRAFHYRLEPQLLSVNLWIASHVHIRICKFNITKMVIVFVLNICRVAK